MSNYVENLQWKDKIYYFKIENKIINVIMEETVQDAASIIWEINKEFKKAKYQCDVYC